MPSWVRYSIAVYLGLLLAGSFTDLRPKAAAEPDDGLTVQTYPLGHPRMPMSRVIEHDDTQ